MGIDETSKFINYILDDGTGLMSCLLWSNEPRKFQLGDLVTVQGKLVDFRNQRNLTVRSIIKEDDPLMECVRWLETMTYQASMPDFTIPADLPELSSPLANPISPLEFSNYKNALENYVSEADFYRWAECWCMHQPAPFEFFFVDLKLQLKEMASRVFECQYQIQDIPQQRLMSLFRRTIETLVQRGLIYLKNEESDLYGIINDSVLNQRIRELIQRQYDTFQIGQMLLEEWNVPMVKTRRMVQVLTDSIL